MNFSDLNNLDLKELAQAPTIVKGVVAAFIVLLIMGIGYYVDWSSALDSLNAAKQEEQNLRNTYTTKKRQAINYAAYKQRLADTEKALAALLRQLPNKSEMDSLLTDINQAGIGRGLEFDLFRPGNEVKSDFYATLPVTIKVVGGYHDLGNFVSDIAKLPRIVTIHDIDLEPNKNGKLTMNATIKTYRYLDESEMQTKPKGKKQ
ncbi:MAG TPA: type 4a pilus biogenesis protein PilO [Parasulfuritortus sp.]